VTVLSDAGQSMQAKAIHHSVEALLAQAVSWSSVKNALASGVSGSAPRFVRVAAGRYELARTAQRGPLSSSGR
jgi:hypothetical protein